MSIEKIIASLTDKSEAARAKMCAGAERWLADGTPQQKTDARRLLDTLNAQADTERQNLQARLSSMPLAARVVEAFRKHLPSRNQEAVIRVLLDNPHSSSHTLSKAYGHDSLIWQMHFGNMAKAREADLWPAECAGTRDANFHCGILADFDPDQSRFIMKPDVAAAFAELGLVPSRKQS